MEELKQKLSSLPVSPGVYQFKDKSGKVIYVGKARVLRNRVRSYFTAKPVSPLIQRMISLINDFEIIKTDSEAESLILEMNLIKKLKPRYNVVLKDDKSFPYIVITNEPYPRVFPTRKRIKDGSKYFGPFTDVGTMKYSLKMLRDIFMIRNCNLKINQEAIEKKKFKVCLEYHIKKCEGPCEGLVSEQRYNEMIKEVVKLLNGKTETLIRELNEKMRTAAKNEHFEEAAAIRNKIESLEVYANKQKVIFEDMKDRDIFGYVREQELACAMIFNIREGKVIGKRHFLIDKPEDKPESEVLESVIFRYYSENAFIPDEIYLQTQLEEDSAVKEWFSKTLGDVPDIIYPKRGENLKLISMVQSNARYIISDIKLQKLKREFIPNSVAALKDDLRLTALPRKIECFDISNIQGTDTVASMVVFFDGNPKKSEYRRYRLITPLNEVGKPDDFASMREVIYRRYRKIAEANIDENKQEPEGTAALNEHNEQDKFDADKLPDLIMIDGGKGQLSSAVMVLESLGLKNYNIIGLAKRLEEVFLPGHSEAQSIPKTSAGLRLLQRVRDEAHRFAVTYHRKLREKRTLTSELNEIKGIGEKTRNKLLKDFG
jgi:excinuclease ABC subunit C